MAERLQKLIAEAGIASRRHAEEMIAAGEVTVNGETVTTLGTRADPATDHIKVRGRLINPLLKERQKVYVLLNKPRGYLSSVADPEERPLVTELVPAALGRLHPVGRLDFNTEGLLILTNDGALTNYVTAARNNVPKVYEAKVKGKPPEQAISRLRRGITLEDDERKVKTAPAEIRMVEESETNTWFEIVLHEGRNQQIRRMFDAIGHSVVKLRRVSIGNVNDEGLKVGAWRLLEPGEVRLLTQPASANASRAKARTSSIPRHSSAKRNAAGRNANNSRPRVTSTDKEGSRGSSPTRDPQPRTEQPRTYQPRLEQLRTGQPRSEQPRPRRPRPASERGEREFDTDPTPRAKRSKQFPGSRPPSSPSPRKGRG
jgi:23S rRNA pseudouridine2605 synthase